jgi:hypothetical protein
MLGRFYVAKRSMELTGFRSSTLEIGTTCEPTRLAMTARYRSGLKSNIERAGVCMGTNCKRYYSIGLDIVGACGDPCGKSWRWLSLLAN